jgi:hypothetical protein
MEGRAGHADALRDEAIYMARQVYGVALRPADAIRYAEAHAALGLDRGADAAHLQLLRRAIADGADVEALEFALRLSNRRNVLTKKLHVLAFLIESDPRYVGRFLNDSPRRARAFVSLGGHTLRGAWKLVRGRWLLKRLAAAHA